MRIDIMTLFPDSVDAMLNVSILGRAQQRGYISIQSHQIRQYTTNRQMQVDDYPYGGGYGMVMQCQPIYDCFADITKDCAEKPHTIYMSPKGSVLTQKRAMELSQINQGRLVILCGHYEGVDQRILDEIVDEEISIGDYVLTGGEIPACVLIDCISRMINGVLSDSAAYEKESHFSGLLEHPQYTRPEEWHGRRVPEILLSGHHANIEKWKNDTGLELTKKLRPDILNNK